MINSEIYTNERKSILGNIEYNILIYMKIWYNIMIQKIEAYNVQQERV